MSDYQRADKHGAVPPAYRELYPAPPEDRAWQAAQTSMPWWNPRYWGRKIWIAVGVLVAIIIAAIIAVAVTKSKSGGSYPDYSNLTYNLVDTYAGETFFDEFDYFTGYDPTQGFVHYVPQAQAAQLNLTYASSSSATLRVDTSVGPEDVPNASTGRFSVRVTSKKTYNKGLFLFDIRHSPYGCGTWPALWLTDPSHWPEHGEIDVMEAVNQADEGNQMTLHTTDGCSMNVRRKQQGQTLDKNCDHDANDNAGCGVRGDGDSIGAGFNQDEGGVMAVEWREEGIRMWQFPRGHIPDDISGRKPNPGAWGEAAADFPSTHCDIGNHFRNQSIVANINLCGALTVASYDDSGCKSGPIRPFLPPPSLQALLSRGNHQSLI